MWFNKNYGHVPLLNLVVRSTSGTSLCFVLWYLFLSNIFSVFCLNVQSFCTYNVIITFSNTLCIGVYIITKYIIVVFFFLRARALQSRRRSHLEGFYFRVVNFGTRRTLYYYNNMVGQEKKKRIIITLYRHHCYRVS